MEDFCSDMVLFYTEGGGDALAGRLERAEEHRQSCLTAEAEEKV